MLCPQGLQLFFNFRRRGSNYSWPKSSSCTLDALHPDPSNVYHSEDMRCANWPLLLGPNVCFCLQSPSRLVTHTHMPYITTLVSHKAGSPSHESVVMTASVPGLVSESFKWTHRETRRCLQRWLEVFFQKGLKMIPIQCTIAKVKRNRDQLVFTSHIEKGIIWQTRDSIRL